MYNGIKLILFYLFFYITGKTTQNFYTHMRKSYMVFHLWRYFSLIEKLNRFLVGKFKISKSFGILGLIDKNRCLDIVSKLDKNGYYVFEEKLSEDLVNKIIEFAKNTPINYSVLNNEGKVLESEQTKTYISNKHFSNKHQFNNPEVILSNEVCQNIFFDENLLHISNEYFKCKPIVDVLTMWWSTPNLSVSEEDSLKYQSYSAQMFHYDLDRMKFLKFFIYLTDVNENNGPHIYVKESHKKPSFFINRDGRYEDNLIYSKFGDKVINLTGNKGTIFAVDTRGLHKGNELIIGERLIFVIEFTNSLFGKPDFYNNKKTLSSIDVKFKSPYSQFVKF
jgi:hypothetical protein